MKQAELPKPSGPSVGPGAFAQEVLNNGAYAERDGQQLQAPDWSQVQYEGPQGNMTPISAMDLEQLPEGLSPELLQMAMMHQMHNAPVKTAAYWVGAGDVLTKLGMAQGPGVDPGITGHNTVTALNPTMSTQLAPVKTTGVAGQMDAMTQNTQSQMAATPPVAPAAPPATPAV